VQTKQINLPWQEGWYSPSQSVPAFHDSAQTVLIPAIYILYLDILSHQNILPIYRMVLPRTISIYVCTSHTHCSHLIPQTSHRTNLAHYVSFESTHTIKLHINYIHNKDVNKILSENTPPVTDSRFRKFRGMEAFFLNQNNYEGINVTYIFPQPAEICLYSRASRPAVAPTQPPNHCVQWILSSGYKAAETWSWPLTSIKAEIKSCGTIPWLPRIPS
jgi:hypothetical protein